MSSLDSAITRAQHLSQGEPFRLFVAFLNSAENFQNDVYDRTGRLPGDSSNRIYVESTLGDNVRALFDESTDFLTQTETGPLPTGNVNISTFPDEALIGRLDRVIRVNAIVPTRALIIRGTGDDFLVFGPVADVQAVRMNNTVYMLNTNYTVVGNAIHWVSGGPSLGDTYMVEYTYQPTYEALYETTRTPRPDKNGVLMPQRMEMKLFKPLKPGEWPPS